MVARSFRPGTPATVIADPNSPTGRCLSGQASIAVPDQRRKAAKTRRCCWKGRRANNLKGVSVEFPLGCLTCITGVSGSGKSTLINETLAHALVRRLGGMAPKPGPFTSLRGVSQVDKVVIVDQSPIGRTPRSNAATYTGVFDEIRSVFAGTRDAKQRGFRASRFSFNAQGGRCEECQGHGLKKIEMSFLPDLHVTCNECGGAALQSGDACRSFSRSVDCRRVDDGGRGSRRVLRELRRHSPVAAVSGRRRTWLSAAGPTGDHLVRRRSSAREAGDGTCHESTLARQSYLLDEPTTGLHFDDIRRLLDGPAASGRSRQHGGRDRTQSGS